MTDTSLSFDHAVEILEIVDISKVSTEDLIKIVKKAKIRWHPDRIAQYKDEEEIAKYTKNFQQIDHAADLIESFILGEYKVGERFERVNKQEYKEPSEVIREHAHEMQDNISKKWPYIKEIQYEWNAKEVILSDGFKLKELLVEDFREDLAGLSLISFVFGLFISMIFALIAGLIFPPLAGLVGVFWVLHAVSCVLGFLPLSRFWLPDQVQDIMLWFINFGLGVFNWAHRESEVSTWWIQLLVNIPVLISYLIKYVVLFPLYELAKVLVKDKVVGVVKQRVSYYVGAAEWYIDDLLNTNPRAMQEDQLYDLSYLYAEFKQVSVPG